MKRSTPVTSGSQRRRAFSPVELLVSIAIVALLLAVLLPSLKKAREQTKQAVCLSNLKNIASASHVYASEDRNEQCIPVHGRLGNPPLALGDYEWGGKSGIGEPMGTPDPLDSLWGTKHGRGPATRPLNDIIYKSGFVDYAENRGPQSLNWLRDTKLDLPVYRCPSHRGYTGVHFRAWKQSGLSSNDHYGNSYTAATQWAAGGGVDWTMLSLSSFLHPHSRIRNSEEALLYMENCGRFAWSIDYPEDAPEATNGILLLDSAAPRAVRGWHGGLCRFAAAFVGGHGDTVTMKGRRFPPPVLGRYPLVGDRTWEETTEYYRHVTVRGNGWQLDVLPAPYVDTAIPWNSIAGALTANPVE